MKNGNYKKFLLLWGGELISSIGGGLTSFGLGVYVFNRTGSAASMALVTLLAFLPTVLLSVPAGVLADRYDRRMLMMVGDGFSALGLVYILVKMLFWEATLADICIGVFVSSVFSSLLEPSYKATVTDLLTEKQFSRANGLVGIAGSARYLISPALAGILLSVSDIRLLLVIDILTFFVTVTTTAVVKKALAGEKSEDCVNSENGENSENSRNARNGRKGENSESFAEAVKLGWRAVNEKKGVVILIFAASVLTCFMGAFQVLSEPFVLSLSDSKTLGICETVCASGMLFTSLYLGVRGIKKHHSVILSVSLALSGAAMMFFGMSEAIPAVCIFGFAFFAFLPVSNNCLDYLVRTNIEEKFQGRAWGLIGFLSQLGYVAAYGTSGLLADCLGRFSEGGAGKGAAGVIMISGILLAAAAVMLLFIKPVKELEKNFGNRIGKRA